MDTERWVGALREMPELPHGYKVGISADLAILLPPHAGGSVFLVSRPSAEMLDEELWGGEDVQAVHAYISMSLNIKLAWEWILRLIKGGVLISYAWMLNYHWGHG
jgi:hypothetical protein